MCRDLKKRDHLSTFLRRAHDAALSAYTRALGDDEFGEALDPPPILGMYIYILPTFSFFLCVLLLAHLHTIFRRCQLVFFFFKRKMCPLVLN